MWTAITSIITAVITWLTKKFGTRIVAVSIQYAFIAAYYAVALAFFGFVLTSIVNVYNDISDVLNNINILLSSSGSGSSDCVMKTISAVLNCYGIIAGINAAKPMFFSSLMFVFTFLFYRLVVYAKKILSDIIKDALKWAY